MLETVYSQLQQWVGETWTESSWSSSFPGDGNTKPEDKVGVTTYLLEIQRAQVVRAEKRAPLQINLRFLICSWAAKPEQANEALLQLAFTALDREGWELEFDAFPIEVWKAFGAAPRPSFLLRIPVRMERLEPKVKLVRSLNLLASSVTSLEGMVVGPDDTPIPGAIVEVPAMQRWTNTDDRGKFVLSGMPQAQTFLVVRAKGQRIEVSPQGDADSSKPLIVKLSALED